MIRLPGFRLRARQGTDPCVAPAAESHPDLPIIVAHAGGGIFAAEAGLLAARYPNVILECSWTNGFQVREWSRSTLADRLLFGSDHADNAAVELAKFRGLGLADAGLDRILGGTAARIFSLTPPAP